MNSNVLNVAELTNIIAIEIKELLHLPDGSEIDVTLKPDAAAPEESGEIQIRFALPSGNLTPTRQVTPAQTKLQTDDAVLVISALRDAHQKMRRPFLSLTWFRDKYLPALGVKMTMVEWEAILTLLVARGELLLEQVKDARSGRQVATLRTPDMPAPHDPKSRQ